MTNPLTAVELDDLERLDKAATPGPWSVWDGPKYVGGGADLCIASGDGSDDWLANMDHRFNHFPGCHNHSEAPHPPQVDCPICAFSDEVTREQRANADLIAAARTKLPKLLAELRQLRANNPSRSNP